MILIHGFRRRCATTPPVATTRGPVGAEEAERSIGAEEAEGAAGPKKSRCLRGQRGGSAIEEEQAADQSVLVSEAEWRSGGDGSWRRLTLDGIALEDPQRPLDLLALEEALQRLAALNDTHARLVELRFFGGLEEDEAAEVLGVSRATASRAWRFVRAW
ncbi:MAG: hypothetical protein HS123_24580 [Solibacteraceae bacterium]|nr:hypothetical protein [Solibacteraceae bacterium]